MKNINFSSALKFGAIIGVIQTIYTFILYIMGIEFLGNWWLSLFSLVIFLILMIVAAIRFRKESGGFINFKNLFLMLLSAFVVAMLVGTVFNILLYNIIDPELALAMKDMQIENTTEMLENFGAPEDSIDEALVGFEGFEEKFTIGSLISQFLMSILWGAILCAILALIFKKNSTSLEEETV